MPSPCADRLLYVFNVSVEPAAIQGIAWANSRLAPLGCMLWLYNLRCKWVLFSHPHGCSADRHHQHAAGAAALARASIDRFLIYINAYNRVSAQRLGSFDQIVHSNLPRLFDDVFIGTGPTADELNLDPLSAVPGAISQDAPPPSVDDLNGLY